MSCAPRGTKAQDLDPEWQAFADYIDTCQVTGPTGEVALEIIAVSSPRFYAKLPEGTEIVEMPKPLLRARDGKLLGRLPYNYPEDPPFGTTLKFSNWENGLPQVTVRLQDPTVSGDRDLTPMILSSATGQYEGGNEP